MNTSYQDRLLLYGVCPGDGIAAVAGPVGVEELPAGTVSPFISMGSEIVPLGLQQVGGKPFGAVAVIILKGGGHARGGNSVHDGLGDDIPPAGLGLGQLILEIGIEKDICKVWILVERILDLSEEYAADDAAS